MGTNDVQVLYLFDINFWLFVILFFVLWWLSNFIREIKNKHNNKAQKYSIDKTNLLKELACKFEDGDIDWEEYQSGIASIIDEKQNNVKKIEKIPERL